MRNFAKFSVLTVAIVFFSSCGLTFALWCLECDSLTHPGCGYAQNLELTAPLVDCEEVGQCYVSVLDEATKRVVRGCRNYDHCNEYGCALCAWDNCNDFQEIYDECIICNSEDDNNCRYNIATNYETDTCPDGTLKQSGCYLKIKDNQYTRDCISSLNEQEFEECSNDENCKFCTEDGCNAKDEFQRCYTCDSETDKNCVYRPDGKYLKNCESYSDHCVSAVIPNGKTVRGCSSEVDSEPFFCPSTNCYECSGMECNSQLVPSNRRMCYQCDGTQAGCMGDQTMLQSYQRACNIFNYEDQCFTYLDESGLGYRGCMSDASPQSAICAADPDKCKICDENNCNSQFIDQKSELFCYKCVEGDEACSWRQKIPDQPTTCQTLITEGLIDSCYYFKYENGEVRRGCTLDDEDFCADHECKTCTGNYCNSEVAEPQTCIQCISSDESYPTCEEDARELNALPCDEEPYYEDRGCYSFKDDQDVVVRGCWNAVADEHKALCEAADNTDDRCNKCFGNECNKYDHSAAGAIIVGLPLVLLSTLATIVMK